MVVYSQQTKFDIKGDPFPTFAERGREGSKIIPKCQRSKGASIKYVRVGGCRPKSVRSKRGCVNLVL